MVYLNVSIPPNVKPTLGIFIIEHFMIFTLLKLMFINDITCQ